jgi:hypothetical protein
VISGYAIVVVAVDSVFVEVVLILVVVALGEVVVEVDDVMFVIGDVVGELEDVVFASREIIVPVMDVVVSAVETEIAGLEFSPPIFAASVGVRAADETLAFSSVVVATSATFIVSGFVSAATVAMSFL